MEAEIQKAGSQLCMSPCPLAHAQARNAEAQAGPLRKIRTVFRINFSPGTARSGFCQAAR